MLTFELMGCAYLCSSPLHRHATSEISIFTAGSGVAFIGEQRIPFKKGTIIFRPPLVMHWEESEEEYFEYWIHGKGHDPRHGLTQPRVFQDTSNQTLEKIASALNEEYQLRQMKPDAVTQDIFSLLLSYLERWENSKPKHPLVDKLMQMLVKQMHDPEFEVTAAMKTLPISIGYLRTQFEQAVGKTPIQFLTDLRINEAKMLLRRGMSVKAAGAQVGYEDPYYFSRIFFQTTGMRPSAYASER